MELLAVRDRPKGADVIVLYTIPDSSVLYDTIYVNNQIEFSLWKADHPPGQTVSSDWYTPVVNAKVATLETEKEAKDQDEADIEAGFDIEAMWLNVATQAYANRADPMVLERFRPLLNYLRHELGVI